MRATHSGTSLKSSSLTSKSSEVHSISTPTLTLYEAMLSLASWITYDTVATIRAADDQIAFVIISYWQNWLVEWEVASEPL